MALFESGPKKVLKKLRRFADEGSVNKVSTTVKEEKGILLEEPDAAIELVELLLDIGHPNLASSIGEEVMRRHRQIAVEVRNIFIGRLTEFSRSTDLLRVTWRSFIDMHDFRGALNVLRQAEEITVNSLFDIIREKMQSSMRFDGTVHPEADQSSLVEWALHLYRERHAGEAVDFLWKVCREVEYPHRDIPLLAFWISNQVKDLDSIFFVSLMGIAAVSGKMDQALQFASKLLESDPSQDEATEAANVMEKYLVPNDRSGRSAALLAEMYTAAGKTDAASKTLENIYDKSLDREELETAIEDLLAHPEAGAAPLLLSAQMNLEKGRIGEATEAVERAFEAGDADSEKLLDVCRAVIEKTGDTTGSIAMKLAHFLTSNGEIDDAVFALLPMVDIDASWVFEHVQALLSRERNNALVLSLLAAVLFESGKRQEALATLDHLSKRRDKKFCSEAASVLDSLDSQVARYPDLLEARALFRFRSEREQEAASDWFQILLRGRTPAPEGQQLLSREDIQVGSVKELKGVNFSPATPWQSLIAAMICLREGDAEEANLYLGHAMEDHDLQHQIVERIERMPEEQRNQLDLKSILPRVAEGPAAETVASILQKIEGDEEWKVALATSLKWDNPAEVAQFKFRYLISRDRVILAGSSFQIGSIGEPLMESVGRACTETARDSFDSAIALLEKPVVRPWTSTMSRKVLEFILPRSPANSTRIRKLIAVSLRTEKKFQQIPEVLEPVIKESGVMELLEEMVMDHPGEYPLVSSLTKACAQRGDFEKFHKYSAVLLELDPGSAAEVVDLARSLASEGESGEAYLYAARTAARFRIQADMGDLISKAVVLQPDIAGRGLAREFQGIGAVPGVLCAIASGDGEEFSRMMGMNTDIRVPLNKDLLNAAIEAWSAGQDDEPLFLLSGIAQQEDYVQESEDILCGIASVGQEPWRTRASRKLIEEVEAGRLERIRFWHSVNVDSVISQALDRLLPQDYSGISVEERKVIAPVVLNSGQGIRRLFQLAEDDLFFPADDKELRKKLAEKCMKYYVELPAENRLTESETGRLIDILLSADMRSQAWEIARRNRSNSVLAKLREGLAASREGSKNEDIDSAYDMIVSGNPQEALRILGEMEQENHTVSDMRALALWQMGYRQQAVGIWMEDFRKTSSKTSLNRLYWAMEQSGSIFERAALRRYMAAKYPGISGVARDDIDPGRLETLSGLRIDGMKVRND